MKKIGRRSAVSGRPPRTFWMLAVLLLGAALPAWPHGTPEETWQPVEGGDVWWHEFDLSGAKPGTHNVIIRARDAAGNILLDGPYNIRIDPSVGLPTARVIYPEKGTVLRRDIHVIGVAGGRIGVAKVELRLDDGEYIPAEGTEYWSALFDASGRADGRHTLYVRAVDPRGTVGPETASIFVLDRTPPSVSITSQASGALIRGNAVVEGRAEDANGIARLSLSTDGGATFEDLAFRRTKGEPAVEFSFPVQSRKMPDGAAVYQVRAEDGTGARTIHRVLFFVDNEPPAIEILAPLEGARVSGAFRVTGAMKDVVGIQSLSCRLGKESKDIEMRPGDPYWTADIQIPPGTGRSVEIEIAAVDRSGNTAVVKRSFLNDVDAAVPKVSVVYPDAAGLAAFPADGAIFGFVSGGFKADSIQVEGGKTYPARPGFRIPASDIGPGRSELKIQARSSDGVAGPQVRVRVSRPAVPANGTPPRTAEPSQITVSGPEPYSYVSGTFKLAGSGPDAPDVRLEYRLGPSEPWQGLAKGPGGAFAETVSAAALQDGPIHLELRTVTGEESAKPVYHPLNKHSASPEVVITAPLPDEVVNGRIAVSGEVVSAAPITGISYTLDGRTYTPLDPVPTFSGAAFSFVVDVTALQKAGGTLGVRALDAAGNSGTASPRVKVDGAGDLPTVQLNLPMDREVVRGDFAISGMAFDDDGVAAVHWRIGDGKFESVAAEQSFRIDVPLSRTRNGEQKIEVYAEDIYGVAGPPVSSTVRVSTDAPTIVVTEPAIKAYTRGVTTLRGTAKDQNGIAEVRVSMDNGSSFQVAEGREAWSLSLNTAAYTDGVHSVLIVAADTFGVESRASSLLNIDNTPPEIFLSEPADGRVTEDKLRISGQLNDNIRIESLTFELSPVSGSQKSLKIGMEPKLVLLESVDVSALPSGRYNLRMIASDAAGNTSVLVRDLELLKEKGAYGVALYDPLPGTEHSGPLTVTGRVTGPRMPEKIGVYAGETRLGEADVDRFGFFRYPLLAAADMGVLVISAGFETPAGEKVRSAGHTVHFHPYGPILTIDSHRTGDAVTGRPWLKGTAWMKLSPEETEAADGKAKRMFEVTRVFVSLDNGRSFQPAEGGAQWKYRLETAELPRGPLPVLVRAEFADGRTATGRTLLTVDTAPPRVTLEAPQEGSLHAESLLMYGTASDDYGLESVEVNLRTGDKAGYGIPQFIQGLYLDTHVLGATYADAGLGVSFFDDNVKLQLQAGVAPPGRFTGTVLGAKLIANVLTLPFDYFLGPDWSFFSMSLALGANFSYFTMDEAHDPLVMSSVFVQWEYARFTIPEWKSFRTFALYFEPNLWFAASDVQAGAILKMALGLRIGIF